MNSTPSRQEEEPYYVVVAASRAARLVVGCEGVDSRDKATLQPFVAGLPAANIYYTDGLASYPQLS